MIALLRSMLVGALLGVIWPFTLTTLLPFSGDVTIQLTQAAYELGFDRRSARLAVRAVDVVLWSAMLGALFGIPLGVLTRSKVFAAWVAFLAGVLAAGFFTSFRARLGIGPVLREWSIPETWLYVLAVLVFALCTARLIGFRPPRRAMAPRPRPPQQSVPSA
jgi:hypothetical protein